MRFIAKLAAASEAQDRFAARRPQAHMLLTLGLGLLACSLAGTAVYARLSPPAGDSWLVAGAASLSLLVSVLVVVGSCGQIKLNPEAGLFWRLWIGWWALGTALIAVRYQAEEPVLSGMFAAACLQTSATLVFSWCHTRQREA